MSSSLKLLCGVYFISDSLNWLFPWYRIYEMFSFNPSMYWIISVAILTGIIESKLLREKNERQFGQTSIIIE
jgi:hypothetical protein